MDTQNNLAITNWTPPKHHNSFLKGFKGYKKHAALALMFLPVVIYFIIFRYAPMYGLTIAFKDYKISLSGYSEARGTGLKISKKCLRPRHS